jgi:HD-GYP domain-containing protein (c-di-GMP phosphodiesterase class II)
MRNSSLKEDNIITELIQTLVSVIEEKDIYMRGRSRRVANECILFANEIGLKHKEMESLSFAALLCDIGMVYIPTGITQKQDKLTDEEMEMVKKHPLAAVRILSNLKFLKNTIPIIRHHHEACDGSGYPDGLTADKINTGAKILAIVDSYNAMISVRPHRPAMDELTALKEIAKSKGKRFDNKLTDKFIQHIASKIKIESSEKKTNELPSLIQAENTLQKNPGIMPAKELIDEIIAKFKKEEISLPVLPGLIQEIQELINDSDVSVDALAKVIEKDPIISLRLVATANSPLYAAHKKILTISDAITRLGLRETQSIVSAAITKQVFQSEASPYVALMDKLWLHSLACAFAAKCIALRFELKDPEKYFLMGLSHDIGKVVLLQTITDMSEPDAIYSDNDIINSIQAIHTSISGVTLRHWKFPRAFIESATSHNHKKFDSTTLKTTLVVSLANMLTRKIGFSFFTCDTDPAELDSAKRLDIDSYTLNMISEDVLQMMKDSANTF